MLRTVFRSDLPQVLDLEEAVHVAPWTKETFEICFRSGYTGWVIESEKRIIGFIIISMQREECHILNIVVAKPHQHKGHGRKLLQHALQYAKHHGIGIAYLEVRRSNTRAITLYRNMQFSLVGERKGYYPIVGGTEDALIFAKSLVEEFP